MQSMHAEGRSAVVCRAFSRVCTRMQAGASSFWRESELRHVQDSSDP